MIRNILARLIACYGPCNHPMIQKGADGRWYCTECGQLRG